MKRFALFALAALAVRGAFAAPEMLAPPRFADPTVMYAFSRSNVLDVATAFFDDDRASNFTAIVWMKWTPRANLAASGIVPFAMFAVSADPGRATREGGATLPDLQSHRYEVPLTLSSGTWAETCLPSSYDYPDSTLSAWQYGCYAVNIETDTALTLQVAGAEKSISASAEKQIFNIMGETASRSVSISAASASATVKFAIATNPLVQFIGAQFDDGTGSGSYAYGERGGIVSNEWRMVVFRGAIAAGSATVRVDGWNATTKLTNENESTRTLWHPRTTFAKDARLRVMVACLTGIGIDTGNPDRFHLYGLRVYRGWFTNAELERMRDLDAAEMTRRGM